MVSAPRRIAAKAHGGKLDGWARSPNAPQAQAARVRDTLERIRRFLNALRPTAGQLGAQRVWAVILSAAFIKWLKGSILHPCPNDATTCRPLAENGSNCRF